MVINCCSRHRRIENCRTGRVIFCGFGNPGFLVVVVELVVYHGFHDVCQVSLNIGFLEKPFYIQLRHLSSNG